MSVAATVDPACALCGSRERRARFREHGRTVVTCTRCDLTYVTPRLERHALLETVYDDGYWRSQRPRERGYADYADDAALHERTFARRWRGLREHLPRGGRVLDVGCADGAFLAVLRADGWDVEGVEPSAMAEVARARLGADAVQRVAVEDFDAPAGHYDLVTLWDVLEHLADPLASLRSARRWIAPGGALVIETQDVRSLAARILGRRWHHYKHDEHLHHFHAQTLRRALEGTGFAVERCGRALGGKHVRGAFVAERAARLSPTLSRALGRLLPSRRALYLNLFDELVAVARPR